MGSEVEGGTCDCHALHIVSYFGTFISYSNELVIAQNNVQMAAFSFHIYYCVCVCAWGRGGMVAENKLCSHEIMYTAIYGFHSIFRHRYWRAKGSCNVDIDQSAGSMVMQLPSEKMLWNPSIV